MRRYHNESLLLTLQGFFNLLDKQKTVLLFVIIGKTKCMAKTGDCVIKHGSTFTTGFGMVVSWACLRSNVVTVIEVNS